MKDDVLCQEFLGEFYSIADWWQEYSIDKEGGGFYGAVLFDNQAVPSAEKSIILNSRILWFFSEACRFCNEDKERQDKYKQTAVRAFEYLINHFWDSKYGGFFWLLDCRGNVLNDRKQTYAQAFSIYALASYYRSTGDEQALSYGMKCFDLIEGHARDFEFGGHLEARSRDWGELSDTRLSEKDQNSAKSMNTLLHVLESYTGLNSALDNQRDLQKNVALALKNSLDVYCEHVINLDSGHVKKFLSRDWQEQSSVISFGHDIESSWLILKAIKSLHSAGLDANDKSEFAEKLAQVAYKDGINKDGLMEEDFDLDSSTFCKPAWWVQAEAMVGFTTMWSMGRGEHYLDASITLWQQLKQYYLDQDSGEWFWFSKRDQDPKLSEYKTGAWKAPYHNGRAMMELVSLLRKGKVQ